MIIKESEIKKLVSESINEFLNSLNDYSFDEEKGDKKKKKKKRKKKSTSSKKKEKKDKDDKKVNRAQIEDFLKKPGVNIAQYAYKLYDVEDKPGKDTNDMKNARSLVYKKRDHVENENGYPYNFTSNELNKLKGIITANELSEAVNAAFKKVIKEEVETQGLKKKKTLHQKI